MRYPTTISLAQNLGPALRNLRDAGSKLPQSSPQTRKLDLNSRKVLERSPYIYIYMYCQYINININIYIYMYWKYVYIYILSIYVYIYKYIWIINMYSIQYTHTHSHTAKKKCTKIHSACSPPLSTTRLQSAHLSAAALRWLRCSTAATVELNLTTKTMGSRNQCISMY